MRIGHAEGLGHEPDPLAVAPLRPSPTIFVRVFYHCRSDRAVTAPFLNTPKLRIGDPFGRIPLGGLKLSTEHGNCREAGPAPRRGFCTVAPAPHPQLLHGPGRR